MTERQKAIIEGLKDYPDSSNMQIAKILIETSKIFKNTDSDTLRRAISEVRRSEDYNRNYRKRQVGKSLIVDDKKIGTVNYEEFAEHLIERQKLHASASYSQDFAEIKIRTKHDRIILLNLADIHIGSIGTDYKLLLDFTKFIKEHDNIFVALYGDMIDNFVKFRNVLAMHQQVLNPEQQSDFFESWLKDIKHKVLFSTWGNHEEFSERAEGRNIIKRILNRNCIYFNGIGSANLKINKIEYKLAFTHKTRYNSSFNVTHGLKRLAQMDIPDADIYVAGDTHNPAFEVAFQRGKKQAYLKLGTLKTNDGYSKRYFSYFTSSAMPCVILDTKEKLFTPYYTIEEALRFV